MGQSPGLLKLERFTGNPILAPVPGHRWESKAVFNPGALYEAGKVHIIYRAIGDNDISVFGYACSADGFHIEERLAEPVYTPSEWFEGAPAATAAGYIRSDYISGGGTGGCEDPRLTRIGETVYMTYVAFSGYSHPRLALTSISLDNFLSRNWQWRKPVLISPPGVIDKSGCIFPQQINGKYVILHRIFPDILIDFVDALDFDGTNWISGEFRITPRDGYWDSRKLGAGSPPLLTANGWLLIYQAVDNRDPSRYKIGAMMLDVNDPRRVLARTPQPLLEPVEPYENEGAKEGVVYPCGAAIISNRLLVYYGGADTVVCVATINLDSLINHLDAARSPEPARRFGEVEPGKYSPVLALCMNCRVTREIKNARVVTLANRRQAIQGNCAVCNNIMYRMISRYGNV